MDEWMDGRKDEWMDGWWFDVWMMMEDDGQMIDAGVDRWKEASKQASMGGKIGGWKKGRREGWKEV